MNTDCELEVEKDKRENSRSSTAKFKPADLSPLLKGEIKWDCGVFVAVGGKRHRVCNGVYATKT